MLELIAAERPDTLGGVPTMLIGMLDHPGHPRGPVARPIWPGRGQRRGMP